MPYRPIDRLKWFVLWLVCLLAALSFIDSVQASDQIYFFVDDQGVTHLSNLPTDPRYQATGIAVKTASAEIEPAALLTEEENASPTDLKTFTPITITPHPSEDH